MKTIPWLHFFIGIPVFCVVLALYFSNYYKQGVAIGPFIWSEKTVSKYTLGDNWGSGGKKMIQSGLAIGGESDEYASLLADPILFESQLLSVFGKYAFPKVLLSLKESYNSMAPVYFLVQSCGDERFFELSSVEDLLGLRVAKVNQDVYSKAMMYPLTKKIPDPKSLEFSTIRMGTLAELDKLSRDNKKHPVSFMLQWEVFHYKLYLGFMKIMSFNFTVLVAGFVIAAFVFWFWKSPFLFLGWWWLAFCHLWVARLLHWSFVYLCDPVSLGSKMLGGFKVWSVEEWRVWTARIFYVPENYFQGFGLFKITGDRLSFEYFWLFVLFVVGPLVLLFVGYEYITKHFIPRHKRFVEDFFKKDKDAEARKQLSITDVEFKHLGFDLKKKLAQYKELTGDKEALFLGVDDSGVDVSLPIGLTNQHIHIMGPTGCGKTALAIMPIGLQVIGKGYGACFVDFKGDYGLIQNIAQKCKEEGKKFYYFSINPLEKSESYNPLSSGNVHSKVDRLINALKLDMEGAASYYTNMQKATLLLILQNMVRKGKYISIENILSAVDSDKFLATIRVERKDVSGLVAKLTVIKDYPMINEDGLDLKNIMDEEGVVYFNLNSQIDSTVAEAVGRMLIVDLKALGANRNLSHPKFFIFIDEFQTIASEFFVEIISKVRSANYCFVLANQARSNLINVSQAFHDAVMINSYAKIIFTCPSDARFWAFQTGSTRIDDYTMRTFAGSTFGDDRTALDGRREQEGSVVKLNKPLFSENVFMKLPIGKSIIFVTGQNAKMVNHAFYSSKEDFRKNQTSCFAYEGGKFFGDPSQYQENKMKEAVETEQKKREDAEKAKKDINGNKHEKGEEKNEKDKGSMGGGMFGSH